MSDMSNERYGFDESERRSWEDPKLTTSNAQQSVTIKRGDLPLYCPLPGTTLWNSHPRVFLEIESRGEAQCPYCGTRFTLAD